MSTSSTVRRSATRLSISVAINLGVAALHVVDLRAAVAPSWRPLVSGYFSDVTLPFAFYFLLCLNDDRVAVLRSTVTKALVVWFACAAAELLQRAGIPALGRTFDPWDFAMYATGVLTAAMLDRVVLSRLVRRWPLGSSSSPAAGA